MHMDQVVRCCLEHAASVAKTFLTSDVIVVDAKEMDPIQVKRILPTANMIPPSGVIFLSNLIYITRGTSNASLVFTYNSSV